jgi:uncharacterized protein (TIGR00251 family)
MAEPVEPSVELPVRVRPRARGDEIAGMRDGRLLVRVSAPPVDGRANLAVCRLIAERLGVGRRSVTIARGESSRDKVVLVRGVSAAEVERALACE